MEQRVPRSLRAIQRTNRFFSDRLNSASFVRKSLNHVFPDNWTFMFGEIALYSFITLVITGSYLGFFFKPGDTQVTYNGSYVPLHGVPMSEAYASTVHISFDIRGGLLIRQMHHWAALVFIAAIMLHACRIFFTAAFRRPREINWLIGIGLLLIALVEGFCGYSLPDDLLSGTGLRIAYSITQSVPVIGSWAAYFLWGSEFPGDAINDRLFFIHVLIIPGILIALLAAHLGIVWHQKHTDFGGTGKVESRVAGSRVYPEYAMKSMGLFALLTASLAALGGLAQINPIWLYGEYDPATASSGSQPDWYVGFLEGGLRLMPGWEFRWAGVSIPFNVFIPAVVLPLTFFGLMASYPFVEAKLTRDKLYHDQLDRPREHPVRTGVGAAALMFYGVLFAAGGDDVLARTFNVSVNGLVWFMRVTLFVLPIITYKITASWCRGLAAEDRGRERYGVETGYLVRMPDGHFAELYQPAPVTPLPEQVAADPEEEELEQHKGAKALPVKLARTAGRATANFFLTDRK
jgi:quinol---cytochrome-c reductase cytochrome b subunit